MESYSYVQEVSNLCDQCDGSRRDARLKASRYDLAFEFITVACAATSHLRHLNFWSVHVST